MRKGLVILLCLFLIGCATANSKKVSGEDEVVQLQASLSEKERNINQLQNLLKEKDEQVKEKEAKIDDLRKRLEMFGVFEK